MIGSTAGVRIWVATAPVDMRQGFDRLSARVREHLGHNPLGGHLFVFRSRSAERVKIVSVPRTASLIFPASGQAKAFS